MASGNLYNQCTFLRFLVILEDVNLCLAGGIPPPEHSVEETTCEVLKASTHTQNGSLIPSVSLLSAVTLPRGK